MSAQINYVESDQEDTSDRSAGNAIPAASSMPQCLRDTDDFKFSISPNFEDIRKIQAHFACVRDWDRYHKPRNLLLAMVNEIGELSELFMWKEKVENGLPDWSEKEKDHLAEELSDVFLYLLRLSEKCHVDLPKAVLRKIDKNGKKYPVNGCLEKK